MEHFTGTAAVGCGGGQAGLSSHGFAPASSLQPPQPIPFEPPFDCINVWVYGNNWAWAPDPTTPPVNLNADSAKHIGRARRDQSRQRAVARVVSGASTA